MDTTTFDGLTRNLGNGLTRRAALRGIFTGAVAIVAGGAVVEVEAKRRKKGKKVRQPSTDTQLLPNGAFCEFSNQCRDAHNICEVAVNASNSDRTCCGATGATCGLPNDDGDDTAPFCCAGFDCVNGVCQPVPDDL
jgi:hypothetical protein